jgi:tetrahydromethanopterin S-methyltransferase subunit G
MIPPNPSAKEEPAGIPSISNDRKRTLELNATTLNKPITKQVEPIFVRIDKFQSAQKNFEHIKEKVKEIESVLGKIKSVRSKEEDELSGWADDIEKIKARLSEVDSDIFDQI